MLRTSERSSYKRCPWQWNLSIQYGLTPKIEKPGALWFGTGIHLCLAEWYIPGMVRGREPEETWSIFIKEARELILPKLQFEDRIAKFEELATLAPFMLSHYREHYGTDPHWEILAPEQRFSAHIPDLRDMSKAIVNMVGTYDMVFRDHNDGHVKMVDHKTAASIQTEHLTMDEQAGGYIATGTFALREAGLIGPRQFIKGMEYNFLRKAKKDQRPQDSYGRYRNKPQKKDYLEALSKYYDFTGKETVAVLADLADKMDLEVLGDVSKSQPPPYFHREFVARTKTERNKQIIRISEDAMRMETSRYNPYDPNSKPLLPIVKHPTKDCKNMCEFFDLCEIHEQGGDWEGYADAMFKKRDPYADHREGADNSKTSVINDKEAKWGDG